MEKIQDGGESVEVFPYEYASEYSGCVKLRELFELGRFYKLIM
jgi:hypothetical protein